MAVCSVGVMCSVTMLFIIIFLLDNVMITPSSLGAPGPLVTGSEPPLPSQSSGTPLRRIRSGRVRRTPYMVRRLRQ